MTDANFEGIRLSPLTRHYEESIELIVTQIRNLNTALLEAIAEIGTTKSDSKVLDRLGLNSEIKIFLDGLDYDEFAKLAVSYCSLEKISFDVADIPGFSTRNDFAQTLTIRNDPAQRFFGTYLRSLKKCCELNRNLARFTFRLSDKEIDRILASSDADLHFYSLIAEPRFDFIFSTEEIQNIFDVNKKINCWNFAFYLNHKLGKKESEKIFLNNTITSRVIGNLLTINILHKAIPRIEELYDNDLFGLLMDLDVRPSYAAYVLQDNMAQSGWIRDIQKLGIVNPAEIDRFAFYTLDRTQQFNFSSFALVLLGISEFKDTEVRIAENFANAYLFFRKSFQKDFEDVYINRANEISKILKENAEDIKYADLENLLTASASTLFKLTVKLFGGHLKTRRAGSAYLFADLTRTGIENFSTARIRENRLSLWGLAQCPHCGALYLAGLDVYSGKRCPFCGSSSISSQTSQRTEYAPLRLFSFDVGKCEAGADSQNVGAKA